MTDQNSIQSMKSIMTRTAKEYIPPDSKLNNIRSSPTDKMDFKQLRHVYRTNTRVQGYPSIKESHLAMIAATTKSQVKT
jgi:hypothetical protein